MSSYLNIYLLPKKKEGSDIEPKPLHLVSYSRNNEIYQQIVNELNVTYIGDEEEDKYTELHSSDIKNYVIEDLKKDIEKSQKRLNLYKQFKPNDIFEMVNEIMDTEEYINGLKGTLSDIEFINGIVNDTENGYNDFEKILCNYD